MMEVLIISIMSVSFQALLSSLFRCVACPDLMGSFEPGDRDRWALSVE
jgi:hypothetical protein